MQVQTKPFFPGATKLKNKSECFVSLATTGWLNLNSRLRTFCYFVPRYIFFLANSLIFAARQNMKLRDLKIQAPSASLATRNQSCFLFRPLSGFRNAKSSSTQFCFCSLFSCLLLRNHFSTINFCAKLV